MMQVKNYAHINSSVYGVVVVVTGRTVRFDCLQMLQNSVYLNLMLRSSVPLPPPHMRARAHTQQFMLAERCSPGESYQNIQYRTIYIKIILKDDDDDEHVFVLVAYLWTLL